MAHAECSTELRQRPFWIPAFGENDGIQMKAQIAMTIDDAKAKPETASRVLAAVHETAMDLQSAGAITAHRMQHYDSLCLSPIVVNTSKPCS